MKTFTSNGAAGSATRAAMILLTAASLLASGCTPPRQWLANRFKVGPNYAKPVAATAPKWLDGTDPRVKSEQLKSVRWWQVFGDSILNSLVQSAYEQNLTLKEASCRVLEARLQLAIATSNLLPQQQQAFADYSRTMGSRNGGTGTVMPNRYMGSWDMGFNLAWELDLWGKYRRAIESAGAQYEASVEDYDAVLVTLVGDVAATYAQIRTLERQIVLAAQNVELQKKTLELTQIRFDGGAAGKLDVVQAEANLAQTESLIPPLDIALRQSQNRLCILLGLPTEDIKLRIGEGRIPAAPVDAAVGIPADLLRRRPDVRSAERQLAAQSAMIGVSTAQLYPQIAITGTIGLESQRLKNLFNSNSGMGSIGPSLRWDILNYGRNLNRIRIADTQFQQLALAYQNQVLQANEEVEDGLAKFLGSQQLIRSLARSVKAAEESVELVVFQYREGKVDFNRVFTTQRDLVQQQNQLAQAQGGVVQGLIQVYRALGGGWEIRCPNSDAESTTGIETPIIPGDADDLTKTPNPVDVFDLPTKPAEKQPALPDDSKPAKQPAKQPAKLPAKPATKPVEPKPPLKEDNDDLPPFLPETNDAEAGAAPGSITAGDPDMLDPNQIEHAPIIPKQLSPLDIDAPAAPLPR